MNKELESLVVLKKPREQLKRDEVYLLLTEKDTIELHLKLSKIIDLYNNEEHEKLSDVRIMLSNSGRIEVQATVTI